MKTSQSFATEGTELRHRGHGARQFLAKAFVVSCLLVSCLLTPQAHAEAKTRAAQKTDIDTNFPSGQPAAITAAKLRAMFYQNIDSEYNALDDGLVATAAVLNGYFADPSTNGSFSAAAWRTDLALVPGTDVQAFDADLTTFAAITPSANVQSLLGAADYSAMRTQLGLVIGTNVQAFNANLAAIAGLTTAADKLSYWTGSGTAAVTDLSSFVRTFLDDANAAAVRSTLTAAASGANADITSTTALNSITAAAATNLTLAGGSSGATMVLGQGTNGAVTITPKGTGGVGINTTQSDFGAGYTTLGVGNTSAGIFQAKATGASNVDLRMQADNGGGTGFGMLYTSSNHALTFGANGSGEDMRLTTGNNLLIGGTTDISGSGGLKVFGATAATNATSGAFQVGTGIGMGGGAIHATGLIATSSGVDGWGFQLSTASATATKLRLVQSGQADWRIGMAASATDFRIGTITTDNLFSLSTTGALSLVGDLNVSGGNAAIGTTVQSAEALTVGGSSLLSGTSQYGVVANLTFSSAATVAGYTGFFRTVTAASAFTMANGYGLHVEVPLVGAASAITTQTGLKVNNQGATGITNAYGVDIVAQSGAATTNVGLRNAGTTLLTNATAATDNGSGALVVSGGGAFAKALFATNEITSMRADTALGARFFTRTGSTYTFGVGHRASATSFTIFDEVNGLAALTVTPGATTAGSVAIGYTTAATNTTSGALQIAGGAAIGGNVHGGGTATFTGNLTAGSNGLLKTGTNGSGNTAVMFSGSAGTNRDFITLESAAVARWMLRVDATAEGGSNAGSDLSIRARTDAGGDIGAALFITRSNMNVALGSTTEATIAGAGSMTTAGGIYATKAFANGGIRIVSTDTLSGAGAVSVTKDTTKLTSTGASEAITLANGTDGQMKRIIHDVDGGSMVLTPTTKTGFSTITFTNAGDAVSLEYVTTRGWIVVGSYGVTIAP